MNRSQRLTQVRQLFGFAGLVGLGLLTGCGVSKSTPSPTADSAARLQGVVYAGKNYMAGSKLTVYQTVNTGTVSGEGYTGTAKVLATLNADTVGQFSLSGITCSSPDMVYITAAEGAPYPAGTNVSTQPNNPNSLMMAAIGDCSTLNSTRSVIVNEASTIAAVWSLQRFMTVSGQTVNIAAPATNYAGTNGVGNATNAAGLAHAFRMANTLSPLNEGGFVQVTQGGIINSGGTITVQMLNALAYLQYVCTIGSDHTPGNYDYCTQLFALATPPAGTAPTNSLQAMLNIARNPTQNVAGLFALIRKRVPFSGDTLQLTNYSITGNTITVTSANDLTVGPATVFNHLVNGQNVTLDGFGTSTFLNGVVVKVSTTNATTINYAGPITFSGTYVHADVAATAETGQGRIIEDVGQPTSTASTSQPVGQGNNQGGVFIPALNTAPPDYTVAIHYPRCFGAPYTAGTGAQALAICPNAVTTGAVNGLNSPYAITLDADDNAYIANAGSATTSTFGNVIAVNSAGQLIYTSPSNTTLVNPRGIAADANGNLWVTNNSTTAATSVVSQLNMTTGATVNTYTSPVLNLYGVSVDSLGNIWYGSTTAGPALRQLGKTGTTYAETVFAVPPTTTQGIYQISIDKSNNVFAAGNAGTPQVYYFANTGTAAAPTYTTALKSALETGTAQFGVAADQAGNALTAPNSNSTTVVLNKATVTGAGAAATIVAAPFIPAATASAASRFVAMDGVGNIYFPDNNNATFSSGAASATGGRVFRFNPATSAVTGFLPCYNPITTYSGNGNITQPCLVGTQGKIDIAIDSMGNIWMPSISTTAVTSASPVASLVQIIGAAAPTWPLKSLGRAGLIP